jgi:hypothetical protein
MDSNKQSVSLSRLQEVIEARRPEHDGDVTNEVELVPNAQPSLGGCADVYLAEWSCRALETKVYVAAKFVKPNLVREGGACTIHFI